MGYVVILLLALYLLYLCGMLPVSTKRAASFVGTFGRGSGVGASFTACTGQIHRIVRFRESRSYSFHLTGRVQQGTVTAWILNRNKQQVLLLDSTNPSGILSVQRGERYYLYVRFENASGDYQLDWS